MKAERPTLRLLELMIALMLGATALGASGSLPLPIVLAILTLQLLLVVGMLATAILGVIYRQQGQRAFWLGFALFGFPALGALTMLLLFSFPPPSEAPFVMALLTGVPIFGWIGGWIGRRFAAASLGHPDLARQGAGDLEEACVPGR